MRTTGNNHWLPVLFLATLAPRLWDLGARGLDITGLSQLQWGRACMYDAECILTPVRYFHGPIMPLVLRAAWELGLTTDVLLRVPSVIFGAAGVWLTYVFARAVLGTAVAQWAALFVALSPWHIYYSRNLRPYALHYLLVVAAAFFCWRLLTAPRRGDGPLFAILVFLALVNHLLAGPMLAGIVAAAAFYHPFGKRRWRAVWWFGAGLLLSSPLLVYVMLHARPDVDLRFQLGKWISQQTIFTFGPAGLAGLAILATGLVLFERAGAWQALRSIFALPQPGWFLLSWWLSGNLAIIAASLLWMPAGRPEYLLPGLAPAAVLTACLLLELAPRWRMFTAVLVWGGIALTPMTMLITGERQAYGEEIDVRQAADDLRNDGLANEPVLAWPPYAAPVLEFYRDRLPPGVQLPQGEGASAETILPDEFCLVVFESHAHSPGIDAMTRELMRVLNTDYEAWAGPAAGPSYWYACYTKITSHRPAHFIYGGQARPSAGD